MRAGVTSELRPDAVDGLPSVLHLAHTTARRGAEVFATELSSALAEAGFDSSACALTADPVGGLGIPSLGHRGRTPAALLALRRRLEGRDVLVAYGASTLLASTVTALGGPPVVYRSIGDPRFWGRVAGRDLRIGAPMRRASRVVALWSGSNEALLELYRLDPERVRTIPNGRDHRRFTPPTSEEHRAARLRLGVADLDAPLLGYVGSLAWEKQPLVALEALRHLPDVGLVVAGGGPLERDVRLEAERLGRRVVVLGPVADPRDVFRAIDALVLPSRTEGMPGVVIEAGLSGVASVATDVGGTSELVDETTGALVSVDHDDPAAAFADGVRAVVTDAARRGAAARERCLAGFTTDRIVHQWSELILEVAAEGRRSRPARPASRRAAPGQASLHLCASSDRRGAEVFALDLVDALRAAGDDAEVRALRPGPGGPHLDVEAIGSTRVDPRGLRRLRHLADGGGVVVAHGADTLQSTAVALLGTATPWVYRSIGDPAYWGGVRAADLRIGVPLRRATTVVTLWPGGADALMARYGLPASRIEVITNAVPAERFPRRDERSVAAARHALGLDERPVVAWVGSLAAEKHPELAVDVVASLAHVQLLVVGDGPLRAELQARADHVGGDRVRLIGQVDRTSDALLAADCLLLTSRTEGVPAVAIEAGLTGLPVVSTDVGGVHRVVEDGVTGRLVGDRDPATFSSAIRWALEHRDELGGAGHERCHRDFTMPRVAADWRDLLARVGRT